MKTLERKFGMRSQRMQRCLCVIGESGAPLKKEELVIIDSVRRKSEAVYERKR